MTYSLQVHIEPLSSTDVIVYIHFLPVTSSGAVLCLPESGVSLTIPEGALASGQQEEVYLAVLNDAKDRPQLAGNY